MDTWWEPACSRFVSGRLASGAFSFAEVGTDANKNGPPLGREAGLGANICQRYVVCCLSSEQLLERRILSTGNVVLTVSSESLAVRLGRTVANHSS